MHSQCDDVICCAEAEAAETETEADASDDEADADAAADVVGCVQPMSRTRLMSMITSGRGAGRGCDAATRTGRLHALQLMVTISARRLKLMRLTAMLEMTSHIMLRCRVAWLRAQS